MLTFSFSQEFFQVLPSLPLAGAGNASDGDSRLGHFSLREILISGTKVCKQEWQIPKPANLSLAARACLDPLSNIHTIGCSLHFAVQLSFQSVGESEFCLERGQKAQTKNRGENSLAVIDLHSCLLRNRGAQSSGHPQQLLRYRTALTFCINKISPNNATFYFLQQKFCSLQGLSVPKMGEGLQPSGWIVS